MTNDPLFGSIVNHREREKGFLVYPVYSRRSGGLSVGINLFPDKKSCSFNCPYCEVFPFSSDIKFSVKRMEEELRTAIEDAKKQNIPVRDICFSGNGEPTLSADFISAFKTAASVRDEISPEAELVLITNGTGLLQTEIFSFLHEAAEAFLLNIWLKLDSGTPYWYKKMNCSAIPFDKLIVKIREFTSCTPATIQTMLCTVDGESPPVDEVLAWEKLVFELAAAATNSVGIRKIQIYGKARPSPDYAEEDSGTATQKSGVSRQKIPTTQALPVEYLEQRSESLRRVLAPLPQIPLVEIYP